MAKTPEKTTDFDDDRKAKKPEPKPEPVKDEKHAQDHPKKENLEHDTQETQRNARPLPQHETAADPKIEPNPVEAREPYPAGPGRDPEADFEAAHGYRRTPKKEG